MSRHKRVIVTIDVSLPFAMPNVMLKTAIGALFLHMKTMPENRAFNESLPPGITLGDISFSVADAPKPLPKDKEHNG